MIKHYDVIVIGAGPAGIFAASSNGYFKTKTLIIEKEEKFGGQVASLYPADKIIRDIPGYIGISGKDFLERLNEQLDFFGEYIDKKVNTYITKYEKKDETFFVYDQKNDLVATSNYLILATGNGTFEPQKLLIDNNEVKDESILYCSERDIDLTNKKVIVLGGGDSATEMADSITNKKKPHSVKLIARSNIKGNLPKEFGFEVWENTTIDTIDINTKLIKLKNNDDFIEVDYDYIFVQYGARANPNNPLKQWEGLEFEQNKIKSNLIHETNVKDLYVIGDAGYDEYKNYVIVQGQSQAFRVSKEIAKLIKIKKTNIN